MKSFLYIFKMENQMQCIATNRDGIVKIMQPKIILQYLLIFFFFTFFLGCRIKPDENDIRNEEYLVYQTVLDSICSRPYYLDDKTRNIIVINDSTFDGRLVDGSYDTFDLFSKENNNPEKSLSIDHSQIFTFFSNYTDGKDITLLKSDYDSVNSCKKLLDCRRIRTKMELYSLPKHIIKNLFYKVHFDSNQFPDSLDWKTNGFVHFSRVGLDKKNKCALVRFYQYGGGGGYMEYLALLTKLERNWVIKKLLTSCAV